MFCVLCQGRECREYDAGLVCIDYILAERRSVNKHRDEKLYTTVNALKGRRAVTEARWWGWYSLHPMPKEGGLSEYVSLKMEFEGGLSSR